MPAILRLALPALVLVALVPVRAFCDEIHLKNGNVLEGKIVSETEDHVTIETDFGTIKVSRAQIASIKRWKGPSGFETPRGREAAPALESPDGAVEIPGLDGWLFPPPPPWVLVEGLQEQGLTWRNAPRGVLRVRIEDPPGPAARSFEAFTAAYKAKALVGARLLKERSFLHSGRRAHEFFYETPAQESLLTREFVVDLGEKKLFLALTGPKGGVAECMEAYEAAVQTLRVVEGRRGGRGSLGVPISIRTPHVTNSHVPPVGPWLFNRRRESGAELLSYESGNGTLVVAILGFWDGHGKLVAEQLEGHFAKLEDLGAASFRLSGARTDDLGERVELFADCAASLLGQDYAGRLFLAHEDLTYAAFLVLGRRGSGAEVAGVLDAIRKSVTIEKDWAEALRDVHWREDRIEAGGVRLRVPAWWTRAGPSWASPGGTVLFVDSGPMPGGLPPADAVAESVGSMKIPSYSDLRVTGREAAALGDDEGFRLRLEGRYAVFGHRFPVDGELLVVGHGDRYVQVLSLAPRPGLERQKVVLDKVKASVRFE